MCFHVDDAQDQQGNDLEAMVDRQATILLWLTDLKIEEGIVKFTILSFWQKLYFSKFLGGATVFPFVRNTGLGGTSLPRTVPDSIGDHIFHDVCGTFASTPLRIHFD